MSERIVANPGEVNTLLTSDMRGVMVATQIDEPLEVEIDPATVEGLKAKRLLVTVQLMGRNHIKLTVAAHKKFEQGEILPPTWATTG